jgi:hypothetical protein
MNIELNYDQVEEIVREYLIEFLDELDITERFADPVMKESINRLIAYHSVPGQWEDGKYDY